MACKIVLLYTSAFFCYILIGCMCVKIAVDRSNYNLVKMKKENEYIYVFDDDEV